jgi:hypothetical protein
MESVENWILKQSSRTVPIVIVEARVSKKCGNPRRKYLVPILLGNSVIWKDLIARYQGIQYV